MRRYNFKEMAVFPALEGEPLVIDVRKEIGNYLFANSADIALSDWGRTVYYSQGEVDLPVELESVFMQLIQNSSFVAPIKRAILEKTEKKEERCISQRKRS